MFSATFQAAVGKGSGDVNVSGALVVDIGAPVNMVGASGGGGGGGGGGAMSRACAVGAGASVDFVNAV